MKIEGEPSKAIQIYRTDRDGNAGDHVGVYDTLEAMRAGHKPRLDWKYVYRVNGKWMKQAEFSEWAKGQK